MNIKEGLDRSVSNQKENSAPSTEAPLPIKGTSKCLLNQGVNFREFPTSVKEIFSGGRQPQDKWYRAAVLVASAAVGLGLSVATVSLLNPQTLSIIRTVFNLAGRIP
ncbi:hypothetical protein A3I48_02750 [Candidatus Daviesbacteria bacterium RIFCSPLOWO2_02_FULL_36_7]|uniref:Uncharacterized protein n=1 Tax=Candidatus Daviesbacteria bacterium RIFCSPLOWO2_02_FULL_36_7 TaxID=1797792 RepID=A0A1F5MHJ6_9BACT|nr:MAG: hypothetical protein A3I48_02750 [Candidatus Daviesbacteria bacterium RIFCSPLOWO2_02_FULL_36_7]